MRTFTPQHMVRAVTGPLRLPVLNPTFACAPTLPEAKVGKSAGLSRAVLVPIHPALPKDQTLSNKCLILQVLCFFHIS